MVDLIEKKKKSKFKPPLRKLFGSTHDCGLSVNLHVYFGYSSSEGSDDSADNMFYIVQRYVPLQILKKLLHPFNSESKSKKGPDSV